MQVFIPGLGWVSVSAGERERWGNVRRSCGLGIRMCTGSRIVLVL